MADEALEPGLVRALRELGRPELGSAELGWPDGTELTIGGVTASALANAFGTPLYVFAADVLRRRVAMVRAAMGPRIELLWSLKANPSLAVTRCLREAGTGVEIASLGELQVALAAGHDPAQVRFAGPGKTDDELRAAIAAGVVLHVESADELMSIERLATGGEAAVALRVNLPQELAGARMRMGGRTSRFGVDVEQVPALLRRIADSPRLRLRGLHVYGGTQCFDAAAFVQQAASLCRAAEQWQQQLGVNIDELDLGGGFGIAAFAGDDAFDLDTAGRGIAALLAEHDRPGRRWFVELGRFLAAPAGIYLMRVVRCKQSGGLDHAVLDGGMHQHAAAAGVGTILRRPPLLRRAASPWTVGGTPVTVGGPLCTPADQFAEQLPLGPLQTGELVAVLHAGAYGLTFSPAAFLSHATAAEVLVEAGVPRLVRRRGEPADALRGQLP